MASTVLNETVFTAVYEWNASKISEILVSLINIIVVTPFAYYIIWYERFGANHRRTLINQLVASICLHLVVYNVFVQSMDIAVTALGPFNFSFCHFRRFVRSILIFQCTLLTTAITIVKYIYIFVMKTPANCREEFWCLFINLWTLMCSCLSHFVFHFLPGRELINIYVCSGSFDRSLISTPVKANLFSRSVFIISFLWFLFVAARIYRYKKISQVQTISLQVQIDHHLDHAGAIKDMLKNGLINLMMITGMLVLLIPSIALPGYINSLDPEDFNSSPGIELYHFLDHGLTLLLISSFVIICYGRNRTMRKIIFCEIKDNFQDFKEQLFH